MVDEVTASALVRQGVLTPVQGDLVEAIHSTLSNLGNDLGITAIKAVLSCDDPDETVAAIIETLLKTVGIDADSSGKPA